MGGDGDDGDDGDIDDGDVNDNEDGDFDVTTMVTLTTTTLMAMTIVTTMTMVTTSIMGDDRGMNKINEHLLSSIRFRVAPEFQIVCEERARLGASMHGPII